MPFNLVSLFTGAGGIDYGFEAADFDVYAANEMARDCCRTLAANRDWPVIEGDIHDISSEQLMGVRGLTPGDTDVLVGGPPCQPFSTVGVLGFRAGKAYGGPARADTLRLHALRRRSLAEGLSAGKCPWHQLLREGGGLPRTSEPDGADQ